MRVTNSMMTKSFLRDMNRNLSGLNRVNKQLTTGKEISKPSDNPFKVARSMQLNSDIQANKQYNENIKDTINWLDTTDTALEQLGNTTQRIRELMVSAGNAAYGSDEKTAIQDEINEKVNEMTQILNTSFDGKYIFGGTKTASKPVGVETNEFGNREMYYQGKEGEKLFSGDIVSDAQIDMIGAKLDVEISQGVTMEYNVGASSILNFKDENGLDIDVMELMCDITFNISSSDAEESNKVVGENLADIDKVLTNINKLRSEVGSKQNRMESAQTQNEDQNYNMTEILSETEDIDFAQKMMEVATMQTVYTASLQTSAKILQPTLLDYI